MIHDISFGKFFTSVALVLSAKLEVSAHIITMCAEPFCLRGLRVNISITTRSCAAIPPEIRGTAHAAKLYGKCIQFYDQPNCIGTSIRLSRTSSYIDDIRMYNFHTKMKSFGACKDHCIPDVGKTITSNATFQVNLYTERLFEGNLFPIQVNGCTPLDVREPWIETHFLSISIPKGECALFFMGNPDCLVDSDENVLEIRSGIPKLYFIDNWPDAKVPIGNIKSIGPCQCKSFADSSALQILELSPNEEFTVLFVEEDFQGDFLQIS